MLAPPFSTGPLDTMWAHVAKRLMLLAIATRSCGALVPPQQSRRHFSEDAARARIAKRLLLLARVPWARIKYTPRAKRLVLLAGRWPKELSGLLLLSRARRLVLPPPRARRSRSQVLAS